MKLIPLTRGMFTKVDDEDYEALSKLCWHATYATRNNNWYVVRTFTKPIRRQVYMHRLILGASSMAVDHINCDGLDNRRANLRFATPAQNSANSRRRWDNTSGYKGVYFHKQTGKWRARLRSAKKHYSLGLFDNLEDAARAYRVAAEQHFGEFART